MRMRPAFFSSLTASFLASEAFCCMFLLGVEAAEVGGALGGFLRIPLGTRVPDLREEDSEEARKLCAWFRLLLKVLNCCWLLWGCFGAFRLALSSRLEIIKGRRRSYFFSI